MDASTVQGIFSFITKNIFIIIFLFVAVEAYLVVTIFMLVKKHESTLIDVSDNLIKGFTDAPDRDSHQSTHEKIESALDFITNKISANPETKKVFAQNAQTIRQRSIYGRHYKIEMCASVMSTLVQIFPLLGILGTILAIAQTGFSSDTIDVSNLTGAFVLAMDTTILGIFFSILFMIVESTFDPKIERVINESHYYKQIISSISLSDEMQASGDNRS